MSHNFTEQWDDIIIYSTALGTGTSAPDLVAFNSAGNLLAYGFSGTGVPNVEQLYGSFEIPHDYKEGSDLYVHVHWAPTTANAGNVVWNFEYVIADPTQAFGANATLTSTAQAAGGTAWMHKLVNIGSPITGTGITIGAVCVFRFYRNNADANDTYPDDASLLSIGVHYLKDSHGSNQITSKN